MYSVMLVDDEEEVRIAIEKKINWGELGFQVVGTAENGEDALEKAIVLQPDVVMTDINMPFMDGLTFSKQLKSQFPATKIVIFSGYDEFEYAKEAIELSAEEYILKPINALELQEIFARIKTRLDDEFDKRRNMETLEKYYNESIPFFREQFLIGLIEGHIEPDRIQDIHAQYGQGIEGKFYCVGFVKLSFDEEVSIDTKRLMSISLNQLAKERLACHANYYCVNYLGNVIVLGCLNSEEEYDTFVLELDRICKLSKKLLQTNTTAGIGQLVGELKDLFSSFKSAKEAISYRMILEDNQAISIKDVEPDEEYINLFENDNVNQMLKQIKIGTDQELKIAIHEFFSKLPKNKVALYQLKLSILEAYFEVIKLAGKYELVGENNQSDDRDILEILNQLESFEQIEKWFEHKCFLVKEEVNKNRLDTTGLMIEKAKEYIEEHFSDSNLSVEVLCNYLNVTPNYFSAVFKKNTGSTFVSFLTEVRLKKAVVLLENTDEKAYIIAGLIGYDEPNYFSYVFKKAYGISPSKYRQQREK